jgi:hypothetical protein
MTTSRSLERRGALTLACMAVVIVVAVVMWLASALAEPPSRSLRGRGGSCPHGYLASGSFCVPWQGANDAIAKSPNGTWPWGGDCERLTAGSMPSGKAQFDSYFAR